MPRGKETSPQEGIRAASAPSSSRSERPALNGLDSRSPGGGRSPKKT